MVRLALLFYLDAGVGGVVCTLVTGERITLSALGRTALALVGAALALGRTNCRCRCQIPGQDWLAMRPWLLHRAQQRDPPQARGYAGGGRVWHVHRRAAMIAPLVIGGLALAGRPLYPGAGASGWVVVAIFTALVLVRAILPCSTAVRGPAILLSVLMLAEILVAPSAVRLAGAATITQSTLIGMPSSFCASLLAIFSGKATAHDS